MNATSKLKKMNKRLDRKRLAWNILIVGAFIFAVVITAVLSGMESVTNELVFAPSVTVNGQYIGGLSYEDGLKSVLNKEKERIAGTQVTIIYNGQEKVFSADELSLTTDAESVIKKAFNYNKEGSLADNFVKSFEPLNLDTHLSVDEQALQNTLMTFLQTYYEDSGADGSEAYTYTEGQQVFAADLQEILSQVLDRIKNEDKSPVIV